MTGEEVVAVAAGRLDAGVHALAQTVHFVTASTIPVHGFRDGLNSLLPDTIAVLQADEMDPGFHALRDAKGKIYRYVIWNGRVRQPLLERRAWHVIQPLDLDRMREGAQHLVGSHDFESFRASGCTANDACRTIHRLEIGIIKQVPEDLLVERDERLLFLEFEGDGFVRHMIRNIVGTIVEVGKGRMTPADIATIRDARTREQAGRCAPACGLYLVNVLY